jgi:hypothetical protein
VTSKRLITLFLLLIAAPASLLAKSTAIDFEEILWWLPERSETLVVAREAFPVAEFDRPSANNLRGMLQAFSIGPIEGLRNGELYKHLIGQRIVLAVTASRHFRAPTGLGAMPYDGCHILVTENDVRSVIDAITESNAISLSFDVEGNKVLVLKEQREEDEWTFYVTAPRPNVLLVTTDKASLTEVLERMKTHARTRAFEESLPEWRYIDRSASFWGLRHFPSETASQDPTSPLSPILGVLDNRDPKAVGFVFSARPAVSSDVEMTYLSTNERSVDLARSFWTSAGVKFESAVVPLSKGGASISLTTGDHAGYFLLMLMGVLGHGVFL